MRGEDLETQGRLLSSIINFDGERDKTVAREGWGSREDFFFFKHK